MVDNTQFTTEQLADRYEDRRDIKNLMSKYVASLLLKREKTMFESFWSKRDDICLGVNEGYYQGPEAIKGFYAAIDKYTAATRDLLVKLFPKETEGKTPEELYGIGPFELKAINNPVIEIATDGETAKGMWCCCGNSTTVTTRGPVSNWVFATYAADFIREGDEWKLWHLLYLEDVNILEVTPVRLADWQERVDRVVVERPKPTRTGLVRLIDSLLYMLSARRIRLDPVGSYAWLHLDGTRSVPGQAYHVPRLGRIGGRQGVGPSTLVAGAQDNIRPGDE